MKLIVIINQVGSGYVSLCPEYDIASQGDTVEQARDHLREALKLFFETASDEEIKQRFRGDIIVTFVEVDWTSKQENDYLLSIPGMRESIQKGLDTPIKECSKKLHW